MVDSNLKLLATMVTQAVVDSLWMMMVRCASPEFCLTVLVHIGDLFTGILESVVTTGSGSMLT